MNKFIKRTNCKLIIANYYSMIKRAISVIIEWIFNESVRKLGYVKRLRFWQQRLQKNQFIQIIM